MKVHVVNIMNKQKKWESGQTADNTNWRCVTKGHIWDRSFRWCKSLTIKGYTSIGKCISSKFTIRAAVISYGKSLIRRPRRISWRYVPVFLPLKGFLRVDRSVSNDTYLTLRWLQQNAHYANISAKIIRAGGIVSLEIGKVEYVYPFACRFWTARGVKRINRVLGWGKFY